MVPSRSPAGACSMVLRRRRARSPARPRLGSKGGAARRAVAVPEGAADAYVHAGGQYEWASAAPVAVAAAAGLVASRLDGSALVYNKADPWSPDLLICHPSLVRGVRRMLASVAAGEAQGGS